jgi:hypothetical protein
MLTYPSGSLYILMEPIVLTYGFPATDISARRFADAIDHAMCRHQVNFLSSMYRAVLGGLSMGGFMRGSA